MMKAETIKFALIKAIKNDECFSRAKGLAFSTTLAIVPFAILLAAFGGINAIAPEIEEILTKTFLPRNPDIEIIIDVLKDSQERGLELGTTGLVIFMITAIILLNSIEENFNYLFKCEKSRSLLRRISSYIVVIVSSSLLIGGNLFVFLNSRIAFFPSLLQVLEFAPFLIVFSMLLLIYKALPNDCVSFRQVLPGALAATVLWFIIREIFSFWMNKTIAYSVVYGSFFVIPILLLWIYVIWLVILFGAEIICIIKQ